MKNNDDHLIIDLDQMQSDTKRVFADTGFTIPAEKTLTFKVSGNPTTGYEWHYVETENGAAFDVVEDYIMDPVPEGHEDYTGIGGTYYFTLSAS